MRSLVLLNAFYATLASSTIIDISSRDRCRTGYTLCSNTEATAAQMPTVLDPALQSLFWDIIHSPIQPGFREREHSNPAATSLCCISSLTCLTLSALLLPFCYDRFTTNFFLPDGSYGTVSSGAFSFSSGAIANLITGNFTLPNGTIGNIYGSNPAAAPNLATLALLAPFIAAGLGSTIPASILGVPVTTEAEMDDHPAPTLSSSVHAFQVSIPVTAIPGDSQLSVIGNARLFKEVCPTALTYTVFKVVTFTSTITGTRTSVVPFHHLTQILSAAQLAQGQLSVISVAEYLPSPAEVAGSPRFFMHPTPFIVSSPAIDPTNDPALNSMPNSGTQTASPLAFVKSRASVTLASAAVALVMVLVTGIAFYIS